MKRAVVEATRTSLRWITVEGPSLKPRIRAFRVVPLSGDLTPDAVRQAVGSGGAGPAEVIAVIPRDQLITRIMKLPSVDPEELAGMVALTGTSQLPYPAEHVVHDFHVIEQHAGVSTVHLVACHRDVVHRQLRALRQAGVDPSVIAPSSWGVLGWQQRWASAVPDPVLVINVDADHTDLVLIRQGRVLISRSLSQGVGDWEAEDGVAALGNEISLTVSGGHKELPGAEARSFVLTGVGPLDAWSLALASQVGHPVTAIAPTARLRLPNTVGVQRNSPVVCVGLAAADLRWCPNLLPKEARRLHLHRRRMRSWRMTGVLWIGSLLVGFGALQSLVQRQARANERLAGRLRELHTITRQTEAQSKSLHLIERILSTRSQAAGRLAELFRATPMDVAFDSVAFERSRDEFILRGSAPSNRDVLAYLQQLEQLGLWRKVELRFSAHRSGPRGDRTEFEIVLTGRVEGAS